MAQPFRTVVSYRIKKRTFVVLALSLAVTFAVAVLLAVLAVWLIGPADVLRIDLVEADRRDRIIGAGVNYQTVEPANLLVDASFEPLAYRDMFTIYDGDSQTMTVAETGTADVSHGDSFFNGATARILTPGPDGLTLKKTAEVVAYGINRIGQFQLVQLPADIPPGLQILDFAYREDETLAIGEQGLILRQPGTTETEVVSSGITSDLTGICASSAGYLVCSDQGELIYSADGQLWSPWPVIDPRPLNGVAVSDRDLYVAVGDDGLILTGPSERLTAASVPTQADIVDVVFGAGIFLALTADGHVLRSSTGGIWQLVDEPASPTAIWQTLDFRDGRFALAGDAGQFAVSKDGRTFDRSRLPEPVNCIDLIMISDLQMIVLDRLGQFLFSNDGGATWSESSIDTGLRSQRVALASDNQMIAADQNGQLGLAPLVIEIKLDQPLLSGRFEAGDLVYLEKLSDQLPPDDSGEPTEGESTGGRAVSPGQGWEIFGPSVFERTRLSAPEEGGVSSLHLENATAGQAVTILSQAIQSRRFEQGEDRAIYEVELWMRQDGIANQSVQLWLSGDFQSVGTTLEHVGSVWKKYAHTFVLPAAVLQSAGQVRLNLSYSGTGHLWLDRIFFGASTQTPHGLDLTISEDLARIHPNVVRLSFLPIGTATLKSGQWALPPGNDAPVFQDGAWHYLAGQSLADGLALAAVGGSDPWLVISSSVREDELHQLLEYLAGSVSTPMGRLRMNQGQILPWTDQFNHIYLEFNDQENNLASDFLRSGTVDWLIRTVGTSPYFNEIKSRLVFVDGMNYSDGVLRSTADYHASKLDGLFTDTSQNGIEPALLSYYDQLPRNPTQTRAGWYELISAASLKRTGDGSPTLAHILTIQLQELGRTAGLVNLTLLSPIDPDYRMQDTVAAGIAALARDSLVLDTIMPESELKAFAFRAESVDLIILANTGLQPLTARLTGAMTTQDTDMTSFDQHGEILRERRINGSNEPLTVLPGGVIVLKKTP